MPGKWETTQIATNSEHRHIFMPSVHMTIVYKMHPCTYIVRYHNHTKHIWIKDIIRSYKWCYHPSTWVPLNGVRSKRQEVSHEAVSRKSQQKKMLVDHQCNRVMHGCIRLYDSRRNKNSDARWWAHRHAVITHSLWLAINQSWDKERPAPIPVIQRLDCNHRGHCNEKTEE